MREAEFAGAIGVLEQSLAHPRFGIYRNNVASALTNSLRVRYPVVEQLVGREFFAAMARGFIANNKPSSAMLISYGAEFPEFIASFEPAEPVPYLADVAKLESAWWEAYHAADAAPLHRETFSAIEPEGWGETRLHFLPSVKLLSFEYSAVSIWRAHHSDALAMPLQADEPECVLITRDGTQVLVHPITQDMQLFLNTLFDGGTLLDAYDLASNRNETFDIAAAVALVLQFNIIAELFR